MSKTIQIALLVVFSTLLISGCSSDKKKTKQQQNGNVVFFHNIENTGELQLKATNTNLRNSYGTVDFQQFGSMIYLPAQSWGLKVVDDKATSPNPDDDEELLSSSFRVPANSLNLLAITATPSNTYRLHELTLARNASGRAINVSHIHKDYAALDVYVVPSNVAGSEDSSNLPSLGAYKLASSLAFGETSNILLLPVTGSNYDVYLYIVDSASGTVVYETVPRELRNYSYQTLLISPNYNVIDSDISVVYFNNTGSDQWLGEGDLFGEVRVLNATTEATITAEAENGTTYQLGAVAAGDVAAFDPLLPSDGFLYTIKTTLAGAPGIWLSLLAGEQWTVIFYGTATDLRAMRTREEQTEISGQATVTVSNAVHFAQPENVKSLDVYILMPRQAPDRTLPSFAKMLPASYGSKRFAAKDGQPTTYAIKIIEAGTQMVLAERSVDLEGKNNYHFVITGNENGMSICQIDNAANTCDGY